MPGGGAIRWAQAPASPSPAHGLAAPPPTLAPSSVTPARLDSSGGPRLPPPSPSPASHAHANPIPLRQRERLSPGGAGFAGAAPHLGALGCHDPLPGAAGHNPAWMELPKSPSSCFHHSSREPGGLSSMAVGHRSLEGGGGCGAGGCGCGGTLEGLCWARGAWEGPWRCRWAHRLPRLPPGVCMCVCVHAPSRQPSPAEPFKNLHMQKTLIPGAFPWLRGVLPLAGDKPGCSEPP